MKVLLKQDVDNLGYAGEIFKVSPGYGRNYLIPRGLAVPATEGALKQASTWMEQAKARREQLRSEYAALVDRLSGVALNFYAKAGDMGKLYGSVTTADIADRLSEEHGIEIDRRKIGGSSLRQLGTHTVDVRLDSEHVAHVQVVIHPEEEAEAQIPMQETAAADSDVDDFEDEELEADSDEA